MATLAQALAGTSSTVAISPSVAVIAGTVPDGASVYGTIFRNPNFPLGTGNVAPGTRGDSAVDLQVRRFASTQIASGNFSVIVGGSGNTASGESSVVVGGGTNNVASGQNAVIVGGGANTASALRAFIGGGLSNTASGQHATIAGGEANVAAGNWAVAGGRLNQANADYSTVTGGYNSTISANSNFSFIGGGTANTISDSSYTATIGGGTSNVIKNAFDATIAGGNANKINNASVAGAGQWSTICGGYSNSVTAQISFIGGGQLNISNYGCVVAGGESNQALGSYAVIGGGSNHVINSATNNSTIAGGFTNTLAAGSCFIGGGNSNSVSNSAGLFSVIGGGRTNDTKSQDTFIGGGQTNTINTGSNNAIIVGGFTNSISTSDPYAVIIGGSNNTVTAERASVLHGLYADGRIRRGVFMAHAGGFTDVQGTCQFISLILRGITTNTTTPVTLSSFGDGSATPSANNQLTVPYGKVVAGTITIVATNTVNAVPATGNTFHTVRRFCIKTSGTSAPGTTSLVGTVNEMGTAQAGATYSVTITADNTLKCLQISCTGTATETIRWAAYVEAIEIAQGSTI